MININLLPPQIKEELEQKKKNSSAVSLLSKTVLLFLLVVLIFGAAYLIFYKWESIAEQTLARREEMVESFGTLEERSKKIAERISIIAQIDKGTNKWSSVAEEIGKIIPEGVYLTQIKIESNEKSRNQLSGTAKTKKEVAALREAMEASEKFEYVDIENSTTVIDSKTKKEIENFSFTFSLSKGALK